MSKSHNVTSGDTLGSIAIRHLGSSSKWQEIVNANPQLSGRRTAADGSPLIFIGDVLIIPEDKTEKAVSPQTAQTVTLSNSEQDVSIIIDGKKFTGFTSYEINLSYDSFDSFSFSAPYDLAIKEIKPTIMPFAFKECAVYYLGQLLFKGTLLTPDPELSVDATEITLQGYPLCGVLNDCTVPSSNYPIDYNDLTIKDIAVPVGSTYGIDIIFKDDPGNPFTELTWEPNEKILNFLLKLAKQRNLLFTNDENGKLVFFKHKKESAFMSFKQGKPPLVSITPHFEAQGFYSHITGHTKNDSIHDTFSYTYENPYLTSKGVMRHETILVDDAETPDDIEKAVLAHAGRMFADCISFSLKCEGHVNENKKVFKKGMIVNIEAPGAMIIKQTDFLAKNIKLTRNDSKKETELELVLPDSYMDKPPEALPWE